MSVFWWSLLNVLSWAFGLSAVYALRAEFAPRTKTWFLLTQAILSCLTMEIAGVGARYARGLDAYSPLMGIAAALLMWMTVRSLITDVRSNETHVLPATNWDSLFAGLAIAGTMTSIVLGLMVPRAIAQAAALLHVVEGTVWLAASASIIVVVLGRQYSDTTDQVFTPRAFALAFAFAFGESAANPFSRLTGMAIPPKVPKLLGTLFVLTLVVTLYGTVIRVRGHKLAQTEAQLRHAEEQLFSIEKLAAVSTLAAGAAHDFNNSLMAILGNLTLALQDDALSHDTRESLQHADRAANGAVAITRNLLGLARRSARRAPYQTVREAVEGPLDALHRDLERHHIQLVTDLTDVPPLATGDLSLLSQICLNLFLNARDAMVPKGGGTLEVSLTAPGGEVQITVSDTGIGIPAEFQPRMFQPLQTTKGERGTGLGLSTSRAVLNAMGGRITYETAHRQGTIFRVFIPSGLTRPPQAVTM